MLEREWMYRRLEGIYLSPIFTQKADEFVDFACQQDEVLTDGCLKCPCEECENRLFKDPDTVRLHLYKHGFVPGYYRWIYHGEEYVTCPSNGESSYSGSIRNMVLDAYGPRYNGEMNENAERLIDVEEDPLPKDKKFFDMLKAAEKPLYDGCKMSLLSVAARITNLKCDYNIPHKAIDGFASLIKDICPEVNEMSETFYGTQKLLDGLELPHQKIDVCPEGCMLFWKQHIDLTHCLHCQSSRYKTNQATGNCVPIKVLFYLPIGPRLQRLYATNYTARKMRWHAENKQTPKVMTHPSHGEAWKNIDREFQPFADEPRNVRLGLCTDGFSPFGKCSKPYSCWPIILTPYNLPPALCMKKPFMFLSLIIPGPKNPKANLDVFLQPLIEELQLLWDIGVPTYDVFKRQNFQLKAVLLWTISDFPAYGMLSGWSTAGKLACPYCMEHSKSFSLKNGHKQTWFDCHRQFLEDDHAFRHNKSAFFKDRADNSPCPPRLNGEELLERISVLPKTGDSALCGLNGHLRGFGTDHNWTKQSIFWQLPYWSKLLIRHNLDIMHIEKNFFDNLFYTIMNVKGKTKDNVNARRDLKLYCKRPRLEARDVVVNGKTCTSMPVAPYMLCKERKKALCEWVKHLKFPDGYASNLSRCVDMKEFKLFGMKSHDCHVFMQRLLPVAFRELLPLNIWNVVTELSHFFRDICSTTLHIEYVQHLDKNIAELLCKLEKIFPPGFFNSMEHLPVHLPYEAEVGGPVQYRWMYPFERFLHLLKKKVGNKARVEGSICNAYLMEEVSNFCSYYFAPDVDTKTKGDGYRVDSSSSEQIDSNVPELFSSSAHGFSPSEGELTYLDDRDYNVAHEYVLGNCGSLVGIDDDIICSLELGPSTRVRKFNQYYINGYHFHTSDYGKTKSTMNSGVCVKGVEGQDYYGILQEVVELVYVGVNQCYKTILFKCDWFDSERGMKIHEKYKLVDINHTRRYPQYDPFVLAHQVEQVYFAPYPSITNERHHWWAVLNVNPKGSAEAHSDQLAFQEDIVYDPSQFISEIQPEDLTYDEREEDVADFPEILVVESDEEIAITEDEDEEESDDDDIFSDSDFDE